MKWVSRNFVHYDRVATPWLILRFVDPDAEFLFVPWGKEDERPADAIPYAMAGVELSDHDGGSPTFERVMAKYRLQDPALDMLALVIRHGVDHIRQHRSPPADRAGRLLEGVFAVIEGIMLSSPDDITTIQRALPVFDGLYATFAAEHALRQRDDATPPEGVGAPAWRTSFVAAVVARTRLDGRGYDGRGPVVQDDGFEATLVATRATI